MSSQNSHRIDLDDSMPCKHCGKETYTEYLCHPKYGRVHTDYHRYCPKCRSFKNTDDGGYIYCPKCITMYEEKLVVRQARAEALRQEEEEKHRFFSGVLLFLILIAFCIVWIMYCVENMTGQSTPPISG